MRKIFLLPKAAILFLFIIFMFGCPGAGDPEPGGEDIIITPPPPDPPPLAESAMPFDMHPLRTAISANFIRALDISNCYEIEQHGGVYRNFDGQVEDIMKILADNGINHVRVRLWVDPDRHPEHYAGDGNSTTAVAKAVAVRAKAKGMGVMLNFHYSDWWANPATQQIPHAWKDIPTKQGLLEALYLYTKETIEEFIAAGAQPDTVQIGNEINDGLLSQHAGGSAGGSGYRLNGWQDYSDALNIAAQAVREVAPNAQIVIHLGDGGVGSILNLFGNFTRRANGQAPVYTEVDYDILGISWYPIWIQHLSIDSLYSNIQNLKQTFGKDVIVCETGSMWTINNYDSFGNYAGTINEESAAYLMTNINGFVSDSGVAFAYRQNGTTQFIPSTPENQARVIRAIMDAVVSAGGAGVMWWGADWIAPVPGLRSNAEMGAIFDNTGEALPALMVLGGIKGADAAKPGIVTGLGASASGDTIVLHWTSVNSAIASRYQLERAQAADGPWTMLSDTLTSDSYSDMGLTEETKYYYRIRAYNTNGWGEFCEPVECTTLAFVHEIPSGLRVIGVTATTVTLEWDALIGAASYKLYGAKSNAEPADSAYALIAAVSRLDFTHSNVTATDTWWYKVSAVSVNHGEGPMSGAVSATVGTAVDLTAVINMANAVLDADFLDPLKASSSTDRSTIMKTDGSNYQIEALYVANDELYLYVALDYGRRPAMWQNDWITVWIDNTNSASAGAVTNTGNFRVAQNQTLSPAATIEFSLSHRQNSVTPAAVTKNTTWTNVGNNLQAPGANDFVVKYRIPLGNIAGAVKGDVLRILVSNTQGWNNGSQPVVGCVIPMSAVTGAFADSDTVTIDMGNALSYTVK